MHLLNLATEPEGVSPRELHHHRAHQRNRPNQPLFQGLQHCRPPLGRYLSGPLALFGRYPDLELSYHYDRASGRKKLASSLGIPAGMAGLGPDWAAWTQALSQGEGRAGAVWCVARGPWCVVCGVKFVDGFSQMRTHLRPTIEEGVGKGKEVDRPVAETLKRDNKHKKL